MDFEISPLVEHLEGKEHKRGEGIGKFHSFFYERNVSLMKKKFICFSISPRSSPFSPRSSPLVALPSPFLALQLE